MKKEDANTSKSNAAERARTFRRDKDVGLTSHDAELYNDVVESNEKSIVRAQS